MLKALDHHTLLKTYRKKAKHYDFYHRTVTIGSDQKGREMIVEKTVKPGDIVLDAGGGTGTSALMAAHVVGNNGKVVLLDLSTYMLDVAKKKAKEASFDNIEFIEGDMYELPFEDNHFDVVLSSYSTCPLQDPGKATLEMLRVLKPGALLGIAHSTVPDNKLMKWIARKVERLIWLFPALSLGCRAVEVLPALKKTTATIRLNKKIGFPLWPFRILIVQKLK